MSRLPCRGSVARAAIVLALLSSRPANAQVGVDPGPPREHEGLLRALIIGVHHDAVSEALAERKLQHLQAKLRRDAERGDFAAVERDACQIDEVKYCIAIHEWLIRWNLREYPDFYPVRTDPVSRAAIAQAGSPIQPPDHWWRVQDPSPVTSAPTIPITIVNTEAAGDGIAFAINGVVHQAAAGSHQELDVAPGSNITYDGGGSLGQRRYLISPGRYEFRSTADGWALYKLPALPSIGDGTHGRGVGMGVPVP